VWKKKYGTSMNLSLPLSALSLPFLSFPLLSCPPLPLEVGPLNSASRGLGEHCKLSQWDSRQRPQTHFWHILHLGNASGSNNFNDFHTGIAVGQKEVAV